MSWAERVGDAFHAVRNRYKDLPGWVLLAQMFLAVGWLRAAVAHALSAGWWSGDEVLAFLASDANDSVGVYGLFTDHVVSSVPTTVAVIVLGAQLLIAATLGLNRWPTLGLGVGLFLNLQFILAGAVNPPVFYVILTLALIVWRLERWLSVDDSLRVARYGTIVAIGLAVAMVPFIGTVDPAFVIEDPAMVLVFVSVLVVGAMWVMHGSVVERDSSADHPADQLTVASGEPEPHDDLGRIARLGGSSVPPVGDRYTPMEVVVEVERRTGYKFNAKLHAEVARKLGVRPSSDQPDATLDGDLAEYVPSIDRYLYSARWVDMICDVLAPVEGFRQLVGAEPIPNESSLAVASSDHLSR